MPRVVPSQVVDLIDKLFPWANDQAEGDTNNYVSAESSYSIAAILELTENLPSELLTLKAEDYAEFVTSVAALRTLLQRWRTSDYSFHRVPGLRNVSPISLIRQALSRCPDEFPALDARELPFVTDSDLRENLRLEMSAANVALANGEWKAATVLAGSVVEALLLWTLEQKKQDIPTATAQLNRKFEPNIQKWDLADYIDVVGVLKIIKPETVSQCRLAKNFRNLIHPGRAQRLGQPCNRGTALSAVAAIELVVNDLTP